MNSRDAPPFMGRVDQWVLLLDNVSFNADACLLLFPAAVPPTPAGVWENLDSVAQPAVENNTRDFPPFTGLDDHCIALLDNMRFDAVACLHVFPCVLFTNGLGMQNVRLSRIIFVFWMEKDILFGMPIGALPK